MDEEAELVQDFDRVLRASLMAGMQIRESLQRREQQVTHERQQNEQIKHGRESRVADVMNRDALRGSFWQEASGRRIADNYVATSHLAARGHPEAQSALGTMTERLETRLGINIDDLTRDHPDARAEFHAALIAAVDDARQRGVDALDDDMDAAAVVDHEFEADDHRAEIEQDEEHADLRRSQDADHAPAELARLASAPELTDTAPQPMRDAAVSSRQPASAQLAPKRAAGGVKARPNRQLVPAADRGSERTR